MNIFVKPSFYSGEAISPLIICLTSNTKDMIKKMKHFSVILLIVTGFFSMAQEESAHEWTQFRGPDRAGISTESLAGVDWSTSEPDLLWKMPMGSGFSEILVKGDLMYTMISETIDSVTGTEFIAAFKASSGEELWRVEVDAIYFDPDGWGDGSRTTPVLKDKHLYGLSGHGKLSAHKAKDGKMLWQIDLKEKYGSTEPRWGFSTSPIVLEGLLIVEVGGIDGNAFVAFDKENGEVVWHYGEGNASFNSPLLTTIDDQQQIIFANGRTLYSLAPQGDTLWTYAMPFGSLTAMPLMVGENKIFLSGVRNPGFIVVEVKDQKATQVLDGSSMKTDFNTCVYHDGYIYGFHVAAVRCISAETGEVKWTKRGYGKGSLIKVDDKLFILSDKGQLVIAEAKPDAFILLKSIQPLEGKSWTAPSFVDGKVYVRNLTDAACYKIK